jgi:hypothetical protein
MDFIKDYFNYLRKEKNFGCYYDNCSASSGYIDSYGGGLL